MMKFIYATTLLVSAILNTLPAFSQVNLPLDASNCAIYNALVPNDVFKCTKTSDLGISRGLIIQMDNGSIAPDAQQVIATLSGGSTKTILSKGPKADHQAAKSTFISPLILKL